MAVGAVLLASRKDSGAKASDEDEELDNAISEAVGYDFAMRGSGVGSVMSGFDRSHQRHTMTKLDGG